MFLTKDNLRIWLVQHPSISSRTLCTEANLYPESINDLYNSKDRNISKKMRTNLLPVLKKYGWKDVG